MTKMLAYDGRLIKFPKTQRLHISYFHPEVLLDKTKIELTVREPELVAKGATEYTVVCYRFFADAPVNAKYLAVVVRFLNGEGFIITAYFTNRVKRTKVIWRKRN